MFNKKYNVEHRAKQYDRDATSPERRSDQPHEMLWLDSGVDQPLRRLRHPL